MANKLFTALLLAASLYANAAEPVWDKFIPAGYKLIEKVSGDLNGDGADDYVLTIKTTNGSDSAGFMIFFKDGDGYKLVLENKHCFYTEFSSPTLSIKKGNLYFSVESSGTCSRYAYIHTFKYRNSEFELIGYDTLEDDCGSWDENHRRVGGSTSKTSTNFLTKKKRRLNTILLKLLGTLPRLCAFLKMKSILSRSFLHCSSVLSNLVRRT